MTIKPETKKAIDDVLAAKQGKFIKQYRIGCLLLEDGHSKEVANFEAENLVNNQLSLNL